MVEAHQCLPVFAYATEDVQVRELKDFLRENGATLSGSGSDDVISSVLEIIDHLDVLSKLESENEAEMILNSVCSLIVALPTENAREAVRRFCARLASSSAFVGEGWASKAGAAVRVLSNLFHGFRHNPSWQHEIYLALVTLSSRANLISELPTDVETLKEYFETWKLTTEQERKVLRLVHDGLVKAERPDAAAQVMIKLLGTYTEADANTATADAKECVRTAVVDPKSFSMDHLLNLRPVMLLEKSEPDMHAVLRLFTDGTLNQYKAFMAQRPNFVKQSLNVDEQTLIRKMRLLTLMSLAEKSNILAFDLLSKELDIPKGEELEEFLIEAIRINAISGKIDQIHDRIIVTAFQNRVFGRAQWEQLHQRLTTLAANLRLASANLNSLEHLQST